MKPIYILFISVFLTISVFAQKKLKAGQTFRDCPTCPEMVVIPSGSFMMGSPENEKGRNSNPEEWAIEGPQRLVNIHEFAAGKFDITKYKDTYSDQLLKLIQAKAKGKKLAPSPLRVVHSRSKDLMSQLKASLETKKKKAS